MTPEATAERLAHEREGFELVDYAEVGLPFWRVRARCEVLGPRPLSAIDEAILRAVATEVTDPDEISILLGLDDLLVDRSVVAATGEGWLKEREGALELTDFGTRVLTAGLEAVSREQVIPFMFDGLLRQASPVEAALAPSALAARGAREVPPFPARKPDLPELRSKATDIERVLRAYGGDRRNQHAHLLAIKSLDGRERVFRPAVALVFQASAGRDVEIAFAVNGELSLEHEQAFAAAGLADRLGLDRALRRGKGSDPADVLPESLRGQYDPDRESLLRGRVRAVQRAADETNNTEEQQRLTAELEQARRDLGSLAVRRVETYEHPRYLRLALASSRQRLLIVSPWVRDKVVDRAFLNELEQRLRANAAVLIGYGISDDPAADIDQGVAQQLRRLQKAYSNLHVAHLGGGTHAKVLICDDAFAIITSFNWLSFQGDPTRTFRDERGVVLTSRLDVDDEWTTWKAKFPPG